jgi:ubiquinone/menaquinone biosynthesis C-methylase UbiE
VAPRAFPPWFSWFLETKLRLRVMPPERLAGSLPLAPDFAVVEVGSGTGVYARHVRTRVASFLALELQWPLIQAARTRDEFLVQVQGSALAVPLRAGSVDLIYMVTVLGELTDPALALREMYAALKPGGFLAIAEQLPDPDYVSRARVRALCEAAGLEFLKVEGAWWSFVATFKRPR